MSNVLLIEPPGNYIRLDRCMQSIDSWGGVYRFPLNLARIAAHLLSLGHSVRFIDLQADKSADLDSELSAHAPDLCILSSGFPSMRWDAGLAARLKRVLPRTHVSTFGVVPTLLGEDFFRFSTWGFPVPFDSAVTGGDPAPGYAALLAGGLRHAQGLVSSSFHALKSIETLKARPIFNHELYRSPFTGECATYIEGSYGCPYRCSYCVVPELYGGRFSKRSARDIVEEFRFVIENNGVSQITLWDEGTTFQRGFIGELCDGLAELRKSRLPAFRNFIWTTRSTTALLDEAIVEKLVLSGLSGITLGLESFDESILGSIEKKVSLAAHRKALSLMARYGIITIGHLILGHIDDTRHSIEETIAQTVASDLDFAQFYCAVPYPGTVLGVQAKEEGLIRVNDLTRYELCNPIMDTRGGVSFLEVANYRKEAIQRFWKPARWRRLDGKMARGGGIDKRMQDSFLRWKEQPFATTAALAG